MLDERCYATGLIHITHRLSVELQLHMPRATLGWNLSWPSSGIFRRGKNIMGEWLGFEG